MVTRRHFLASTAAASLALGASAGCVSALTDSGASQPAQVRAERVASGFTSPLDFAAPPGVDDRYFVADQAGQLYAVPADGDGGGDPSLVFDLTDRMVSVGGYTEQGFLGMAFHPDFESNDRLYLRYSAPNRPGTPDDYSHTFVLSEFRATADRSGVVEGSERTLLEIPEPQSNHNAGALAFGPDGYLYVAVGDGGGGGDRGAGHVEDWYDSNSGGNGQDVTANLLGSILRIDVDSRDGEKPYGIPDSNPLVGREGLDEQYAWGFRNPWRMSFDVPDGPDSARLLAADVGQNAWEEVDVVERGGNYGWNVREATHCYGADDCPTATPDGSPLLDPVVEYPHSGDGVSGISVTGGYVYRGDALPGLAGRYVFGDWRGSFAGNEKRLFVATPTENGRWTTDTLPVAGLGDAGRNLLSFGRDREGELYLLTSQSAGVGGETGELFRLTAAGGGDGGGGGSGSDGGDAGDGSDTTTDDGTGTTAADPTPDDATSGASQPGLGVLAALGGIGGGLAARRWWRSRG